MWQAWTRSEVDCGKVTTIYVNWEKNVQVRTAERLCAEEDGLMHKLVKLWHAVSVGGSAEVSDVVECKMRCIAKAGESYEAIPVV